MLFARAASAADLSVVEGVMGLFDGRNGADEEGSTAQIAKLLEAPVLVVIDVARTARTAGAMHRVASTSIPSCASRLILNRVASESHAPGSDGGGGGRDRSTGAGSVPAQSGAGGSRASPGPGARRRIAYARGFLRPAGSGGGAVPGARSYLGARRSGPVADGPAASPPVGSQAVVAIAQDSAFSFYYEDSLDLLRLAGAELVPFSPLHDQQLPRGTQGVYLGGGFPELFAAELAANEPMRREVKAAAEEGIPLYGECGGLMYLGRSLTDFEGVRHEMVGLLPLQSAMRRQRAALGYRTARALRSNC